MNGCMVYLAWNIGVGLKVHIRIDSIRTNASSMIVVIYTPSASV